MKKIIFGDCGHPLDSLDPVSGTPKCSFCANEPIVDEQSEVSAAINTEPTRPPLLSVIMITLAILFCGVPILGFLMFALLGSA